MTRGTGLDTYQICIQARFDTYQIPSLRTPKSPKVPGECWEECREKGDCWGDCWEQCRFSVFPKKPASRHCSQQSSQQSPFSRHSSQHSPRHFWGFGRSQSCSRSLGFQRKTLKTCTEHSVALDDRKLAVPPFRLSRESQFAVRNGLNSHRFATIPNPEGPKIKKIRDFDRD